MKLSYFFLILASFALVADAFRTRLQAFRGMTPCHGSLLSGPPPHSLFYYAVDSIHSPGVQVPLKQYFGKKVYVAVNVATKNPIAEKHLSELQTLYDRYKESGLEILAFPSNTFGKEPGTNGEILQRLVKDFKVTFPIFGKLECQKGLLTHPLYKFLSRSVENGWLGPDIRRDFVRFVCNDFGYAVRRYHPNTAPLTMEPLIQAMLTSRRHSGSSSDNYFGNIGAVK